MIISVFNQKGGVSKTTTVLNLGVALAEAGHRVLLVDLDPQGTLLFHVEDGNVVDGIHTNIQVLKGDNRSLAKILRRQEFDFALLDCPPALMDVTAAALKTSHLAIAPTPPRLLDIAGLAQLQESVRTIRKSGNAGLKLRILLSMRDARIGVQNDYETQLRAALGRETFETVIPRAAVFEKAADAHQSVLTFAARSPGADAYRALAKEVMQLA